MRRIVLVLFIIALVPMLASCFATGKKAAKDTGEVVGGTVLGTGKGTVDVAEGTGKGVVDLGKGTAGAVVGTAKATGYTLVGHGQEAVDSGKEAAKSGGEGLKGAVEQPVKGVAAGLQIIDREIKKATGREEAAAQVK